MGLFSELHIAWLAARIRELAMTPIEPGNPNSMTIRDAVARKFARDLLTDDPDLDGERFLQDCGALSQST
jgi:hypothetical protein